VSIDNAAKNLVQSVTNLKFLKRLDLLTEAFWWVNRKHRIYRISSDFKENIHEM